MSRDKLLNKLKSQAERWREHPWVSNDHAEAIEYKETREQLEGHGVTASIAASGSNLTDYQVVLG